METRQYILALSAVLILAASYPAQAAECTAAKSKADKLRMDTLMTSGDLRPPTTSYPLSTGFWAKTTYAQKRALAESITCAIAGPGSKPNAMTFTFDITVSGQRRYVALWHAGTLTMLP